MKCGYETDILAWSEQQAQALRAKALDLLDWLNIAEEIEAVGRGELRACSSLLVQALVHMLKIKAWPHSDAVPAWQAEVIGFRQDAIEAFSPSMRQRLDLAKLYARALRKLPATIDGQPPLKVPATCPVTLDELLSEP